MSTTRTTGQDVTSAARRVANSPPVAPSRGRLPPLVSKVAKRRSTRPSRYELKLEVPEAGGVKFSTGAVRKVRGQRPPAWTITRKHHVEATCVSLDLNLKRPSGAEGKASEHATVMIDAAHTIQRFQAQEVRRTSGPPSR